VGIGDERVVEPLMEKVLDSGPQVRRKIIIGLGKLGDKRATPVLLKILKHTTESTDHLLVVKTLGNLKDKRSLKTLNNLAKASNEVGLEAVKVLKNFEEYQQP
jgi:HEAT repeat protein